MAHRLCLCSRLTGGRRKQGLFSTPAFDPAANSTVYVQAKESVPDPWPVLGSRAQPVKDVRAVLTLGSRWEHNPGCVTEMGEKDALLFEVQNGMVSLHLGVRLKC